MRILEFGDLDRIGLPILLPAKKTYMLSYIIGGSNFVRQMIFGRVHYVLFVAL